MFCRRRNENGQAVACLPHDILWCAAASIHSPSMPGAASPRELPEKGVAGVAIVETGQQEAPGVHSQALHLTFRRTLELVLDKVEPHVADVPHHAAPQRWRVGP